MRTYENAPLREYLPGSAYYTLSKVIDATIEQLAALSIDIVFPHKPDELVRVDELLNSVASQARYLLKSILLVLLDDERILFENGMCRLKTASACPREEGALLIERLCEQYPDEPMFPMLLTWWVGLPNFVSGKKSGTEILFPRGNLGQWAALHQSSNIMRHYTITACSLALEYFKPGTRVLEIGGGTGAALRIFSSRRSLDTLSEYVFSDVSASFFANLGEFGRLLPVTCLRFDFDRAPETQGLDRESFDVVIGINALHAAVNIVESMKYVASTIKPGGALILGEGAPGADGRLWRPDLLFAMLSGWWNVILDPVFRPRSGFLSLEEWTRLLRLTNLEVDAAATKTFRPDCHGGAFAARKPG